MRTNQKNGFIPLRFISNNKTKTHEVEIFHNLGQWLRARWFRLRQPDLAMFVDQMTNTGVFFDSTVICKRPACQDIWAERKRQEN